MWLVGIVGGALAVRRQFDMDDLLGWGQVVVRGLVVGLIAGAGLALFNGFMLSLLANGVDVRRTLVNVTDDAMLSLSLGQGLALGPVLLLLSCMLSGLVGAAGYHWFQWLSPA